VCAASRCGCAAGLTACEGACVDTRTSDSHCGACGRRCVAGSTCRAGACPFVSASSWPFDGHDLRHSGANPGESGHPPLRAAWSGSVGTTSLSPAVVENGRAFVTSSGYFGSQQLLVAYDAERGTELWRYNFGNVFSVGHPAALDGRVYVAQSNNGGSTYLFAFDAASGMVVWRSPFGSQWERYYSPIVQGGRVYINGGTYGGLDSFNAADGAAVFHVNLDQYDEWSPAYWGGRVYTYMAGHLRSHDPLSGAPTLVTNVPWVWAGYSMRSWPAFDDTRCYVIAPPNLSAIDPATSRVAWTANASFTGAPAVDAGVVYAISGGSLMARDAATGALLWSFVGDGRLSAAPVIAAGTVYVSSAANVYAVDVASHAMRWSEAAGGALSVAAGRLFVAGMGTLRAYALTP